MIKNVKKNFLWNTIGSTFYAFSSLFLLIIVTRINGIELAGIFTFGFSLASLLFYVAFYYGRVYQIANNVECSDKEFTITRILTSAFMLFICLFFILSRSYSGNKSIIIFLLCFWKFSEAIFENFYAIFQKNNDLYKVGISQFLKNFFGVIIFLIVNFYTKNLIFSILSLIILGYFVFILYDIRNINNYNLDKKYSKKNVLILLKVGIYPFLASFLMMYLSTAEKFIIDYKLTDSLQTIFGIIIMPASIVVLFVNYVIQPFILQIKEYNFANKFLEIKKMIKKITFFTLIFGIIAIGLGWFMGCEVLEFIYDVDIFPYKMPFIIILIGAILYGISTIFSILLTTFDELKRQVWAYLIVSIVTTIISGCLIIKFGLTGAAIAYLFSMSLLALLLLAILLNYFKTKSID